MYKIRSEEVTNFGKYYTLYVLIDTIEIEQDNCVYLQGILN